MLSRLDLPRISGDEDATALTATVRLADICTGSPLTAIGLEVPVAMCREGLVTWFPCIVAVPGPRGVLALRPTFLWPAETLIPLLPPGHSRPRELRWQPLS